MRSYRYLPAGYIPVGAVSPEVSVTTELPHPQFPTSPSCMSEESDITDLAKALEKMSVHSPISPENSKGDEEPNLKPIDGRLSVKSPFTQPSNKEPHAQKSTEYTVFVTMPDSHNQPLIPSLYFEVALEFLHKENEFTPSER